jgi:hypothetical protein
LVARTLIHSRRWARAQLGLLVTDLPTAATHSGHSLQRLAAASSTAASASSDCPAAAMQASSSCVTATAAHPYGSLSCAPRRSFGVVMGSKFCPGEPLNTTQRFCEAS